MKKIMALLLAAAMILSLTACGGSQPKQVELSALYEQFQEILPEMMVLNETTMLNFLGVEAEDCTQAVTAICASGLRADEVWLIEAKDQEALDRILALVHSRITAKEQETVSYLPEQYVIVQDAVVINKGLYVIFLVSPDVDQLEDIVNAAFE